MATQLLSALNALYHHEDLAVKNEADKWLEQWQQSVEAWSVADAVLHDPSSNMEAQYFCAQTLRTKVQRDYEELPPDATESLRESLLNLLIKYSKGAPPVRTQLCLALAAVAAHMPAERWGEGGVVRWLASKFTALPAESALPCMLELLTVLPQEAHSYKIAVRPERRRQFQEELQGNAGAALEILTSCLSQPGDRTRTQVMEAFGSWLKLNEGRQLQALTGPLGEAVGGLAGHPLVAAALDGLQSTNDIFHAAVDALCEVIWTTVDHSGYHNQWQESGPAPAPPAMLQASLPLVQAIVPAIMALRPRLAVAARRHNEDDTPGASGGAEKSFDDDEDSAKGMARLFCEVGEAYLSLIISATPEVQPPVEALLEVAAYPDFNICAMSFNFWHRLSRQLRSLSSGLSPAPSMQQNGSSQQQQQATQDPERERRRQFFVPAFERLVTLIRGRVREPEGYMSWGKDEKHEFRRARADVADTLEDATAVLGYSRTLALLMEPLAALAAASGAGGQSGAAFDWRTAEAALYCIKSVARYATTPGDASLAGLLDALPTLPQGAAPLQATVCNVIGRYAKWLGRSMRAGQCEPLLQRLLALVVTSLGVLPAQPAASHAIRELCDECGPFLGPSIQDLLGLYQKVLAMGAAKSLSEGAAAGSSSSGSSSNRPLQEEDVEAIMSAVCKAVCQCVPEQQLPDAARTLLRPVLQMLQQVVQQIPPTAASTSLSSEVPLLNPLTDRLAVLFGKMDRPAIVAELLLECWPVLDVLLVRGSGDRKLTEHVLRTLRYGIKGSGKACARMLPILLEVLPARFQQTRHSAFLFIVSELVKMFGDETAHDNAMSQIFSGLSLEATRGLTTFEQLTADPEMVDDTYLLAMRVLGYAPRLLVCQPDTRALSALLDTALLGVVLQHREANGSVMGFVVRLVDPATMAKCPPGAEGVMQSLVAPRGPTLVRLLLAGIACVLPPGQVNDAAMTLVAVLRAAGATGLSWLTSAVSQLPDMTATQQDKEAFVGAATAAAASADMSAEAGDRRWEAAAHEFAELCRRNKRSLTAAHSALLPSELAMALASGRQSRHKGSR